jgi:hypothetical protein
VSTVGAAEVTLVIVVGQQVVLSQVPFVLEVALVGRAQRTFDGSYVGMGDLVDFQALLVQEAFAAVVALEFWLFVDVKVAFELMGGGELFLADVANGVADNLFSLLLGFSRFHFHRYNINDTVTDLFWKCQNKSPEFQSPKVIGEVTFFDCNARPENVMAGL